MTESKFNNVYVQGLYQATTRRFNKDRMVLEFEITDAEGHDLECQVPACYAVCPTCKGHGTHINPFRDGLTLEDFEKERNIPTNYYLDESFTEERLTVTCYGCGGDRVIPVVDESTADPQLAEEYRMFRETEHDMDQMLYDS